jgi:hypothetical protein
LSSSQCAWRLYSSASSLLGCAAARFFNASALSKALRNCLLKYSTTRCTHSISELHVDASPLTTGLPNLPSGDSPSLTGNPQWSFSLKIFTESFSDGRTIFPVRFGPESIRELYEVEASRGHTGNSVVPFATFPGKDSYARRNDFGGLPAVSVCWHARYRPRAALSSVNGYRTPSRSILLGNSAVLHRCRSEALLFRFQHGSSNRFGSSEIAASEHRSNQRSFAPASISVA